MVKRIVFCLAILVVTTVGVFSWTHRAISVPWGNMSREEFLETYRSTSNATATDGFHSINIDMVPNSVQQAVWRELERYTLRDGDVFSVHIFDRTFNFAFHIQIIDNRQRWYGWVWRALR